MTAQLELTQKPFIELQIEALAQENHIKLKKTKKFIDELEARLLAIQEINYDKILNRKIRLPIVGRPGVIDDDYPKEFKFSPPKKLHVIGGFKTLTSLRRAQYVDLAVEMPSRCIGQKDIKNQRYQHKRALYLAQIAHLLNGSTGLGIVDKIEFRFFNGDLYKPVLLISPKSAKLKESIIFQIFVVPDQEEFNIRMGLLSPNHGNVAPRWFFRDYDFKSLEDNDDMKDFIESDSDACPTPFYNSSILFDAESVANSDTISEHVGTGTSVSEAVILIKVWLFQRELHSMFSFILSMFVAHLITKQKIHQNMSSFQIFKMTLKALLESDWADEGISFFEDNKRSIEQFRSHFPVVFLSPSGRLNLCYNTTLDTYRRLVHEARVANKILSSTTCDIFDMLFLGKVEFRRKFDVIVHLPKCTRKSPETIECIKWLMDYGVMTPRVYSNDIMNLVHKSMSDRIELAQQNPHQLLLDKKWPLRGLPYDPTNEEQSLSFGLLLDAEKSLRIIDVGPEAQTDEANEFQRFWGPKSQLRLQNGVISETVVWHVENFSQRRAIIKYILDHTLKKVPVHTVVTHYTQIEKFVELKDVHFLWRDEALANGSSKENSTRNQAQKRKYSHIEEKSSQIGKPIGVGEEIYHRVLNGYNSVNKVLRSIEGLKHSISSIQPVSQHLRSSGVFPPMPVSLQARNKELKRHKGVTLIPEKFENIGKILTIEPIEILVTLDSTSKWPNEFESLEAEKLEHLINLGEKLRSREITVNFNEDYLDILYGQFVYRIRIACHKELSVIAQAKGKQELNRRRLELEVMPRVHGALDQLYREKPAFSLTCRIVKRWISCHLMTDYLNDMTIDLIVAHLFLHPEPYTEPASASCGFKRFLQLMSEHDWNESPLIVNFDNQFKLDEIRQLRDAVVAERNKYPAMIICTPFDKERPSPWTRQEPSGERLDMFRKICTKGLEFYIEQILSNEMINMDECRSLFRPNFKLFNIIVKLFNHVVQTYFMSIDAPKDFRMNGKENPNSGLSAMKVMPIVGMNAVEQFVGLLREEYDEKAWFFYDKYGQRVIGVLLKPSSDQKSDTVQLIKGIKKLGAKLVSDVSTVNRNS